MNTLRAAEPVVCADCRVLANSPSVSAYSAFHLSVWRHRTRERSAGFSLALTPPLPEGEGE
jgi:hypothetical protein